MDADKKVNDKQESAETFAGRCCCMTQTPKGMPECCKGMAAPEDWCAMMSKGMKACRWFPLIPIVAGIGLFVLGYYLNTEIARVLCMLAGGSLALFGLLGLVMVRWMKKMCC